MLLHSDLVLAASSTHRWPSDSPGATLHHSVARADNSRLKADLSQLKQSSLVPSPPPPIKCATHTANCNTVFICWPACLLQIQILAIYSVLPLTDLFLITAFFHARTGEVFSTIPFIFFCQPTGIRSSLLCVLEQPLYILVGAVSKTSNLQINTARFIFCWYPVLTGSLTWIIHCPCHGCFCWLP